MLGDEGLMNDVSLFTCLIMPCGNVSVLNVLVSISEWWMACSILKYVLVSR